MIILTGGAIHGLGIIHTIIGIRVGDLPSIGIMGIGIHGIIQVGLGIILIITIIGGIVIYITAGGDQDMIFTDTGHQVAGTVGLTGVYRWNVTCMAEEILITPILIKGIAELTLPGVIPECPRQKSAK